MTLKLNDLIFLCFFYFSEFICFMRKTKQWKFAVNKEKTQVDCPFYELTNGYEQVMNIIHNLLLWTGLLEDSDKQMKSLLPVKEKYYLKCISILSCQCQLVPTGTNHCELSTHAKTSWSQWDRLVLLTLNWHPIIHREIFCQKSLVKAKD